MECRSDDFVATLGMFVPKRSDEYCEKHDSPKYVGKNGKAICYQCVKENVRRKDEVLAKDYLFKKRKYSLEDNSIWGDPALGKATFDSYRTKPNSEEEFNKTKALKLANQLLDRKQEFNIILSGNPGVGKSHLAASILRYVIENSEQECLFINIDEWYGAIKDSWNGGEKPKANVQKIVNADLVVIDDLGTETSMKSQLKEANDDLQGRLFSIFDRRKRTIITTNMQSTELNSMYNAKLISRMFLGINKRTQDERIIAFKNAVDKRGFL
ncbi:ATP-binding protein [Ligilactobacillus sp. WILCCON 0076]|uniref:ATP-binding protein n=1 Tax=Ligilactobacillus ubinensis TaxID=2876789 RepID=A0A9X2FMH6_9LACO|nr:ATP-binding protein [Ligilactobacillus ubinensis]MCP0886953.1 ATP-binding protein [Ligilactobacillus ubinensis]